MNKLLTRTAPLAVLFLLSLALARPAHADYFSDDMSLIDQEMQVLYSHLASTPYPTSTDWQCDSDACDHIITVLERMLGYHNTSMTRKFLADAYDMSAKVSARVWSPADGAYIICRYDDGLVHQGY